MRVLKPDPDTDFETLMTIAIMITIIRITIMKECMMIVIITD